MPSARGSMAEVAATAGLLALVLGNEALGIDREVLAVCDELIEIPVFGYKNSLNVASACAVVLFEILRGWQVQV